MVFKSTDSRLLCVALTLFLAAPGRACDSTHCECGGNLPIPATRSGSWFLAESDNFQVCSLRSAAEAEHVARHCEGLRHQLTAAWNPSAEPWQAKCQIVLYASRDHYAREVGGAGAATVGSSLVRPATGKVTSRRIDLRTDVDDVLTAALPHELCHVVVADRFRRGAPPLWFDEGVAILYDSPEKQQFHERDRRTAEARGSLFSVAELLTMNTYPGADRWGEFYGQSAAMVRLLLTHGDTERLERLVERADVAGPQAALRELYHRDVAIELTSLPTQQASPFSAVVFRARTGDGHAVMLPAIARSQNAFDHQGE